LDDAGTADALVGCNERDTFGESGRGDDAVERIAGEWRS
jgi:hypothetical protein